MKLNLNKVLRVFFIHFVNIIYVLHTRVRENNRLMKNKENIIVILSFFSL